MKQCSHSFFLRIKEHQKTKKPKKEIPISKLNVWMAPQNLAKVNLLLRLFIYNLCSLIFDGPDWDFFVSTIPDSIQRPKFKSPDTPRYCLPLWTNFEFFILFCNLFDSGHFYLRELSLMLCIRFWLHPSFMEIPNDPSLITIVFPKPITKRRENPSFRSKNFDLQLQWLSAVIKWTLRTLPPIFHFSSQFRVRTQNRQGEKTTKKPIWTVPSNCSTYCLLFWASTNPLCWAVPCLGLVLFLSVLCCRLWCSSSPIAPPARSTRLRILSST